MSSAASPRIFRLVLTGGPCGGKSSALSVIKASLETKGYDVYSAPEVPTIMISGGCAYPGNDGGLKLLAFETAIIKLQLQLEDSFSVVAASTGRCGYVSVLASISLVLRTTARPFAAALSEPGPA